jgi:hypothetical protein
LPYPATPRAEDPGPNLSSAPLFRRRLNIDGVDDLLLDAELSRAERNDCKRRGHWGEQISDDAVAPLRRLVSPGAFLVSLIALGGK